MENGKSNASIAVLIASLNEEKGIGPTIEDVRKVLERPYFLVVDGNSFDRTVEIAKGIGADILLQNGLGKGQAISEGIEKLTSDTKYVIFIDADYTYPAEHIPRMIEVLEKNPDVGMVIGNRFDKRFDIEEAMNSVFYLGNRFLSLVQHMVNGIRLRDPLSGLRVVRSEILRSWKPKSKGFGVEAEMNYCVERSGYEIVEIPIGYRKRLGEKKLKFRHGLFILRRIIVESLS